MLQGTLEDRNLQQEFDEWRFNFRASNIEPLIRLNVESRGDAVLVQQKVDEILSRLAKLD